MHCYFLEKNKNKNKNIWGHTNHAMGHTMLHLFTITLSTNISSIRHGITIGVRTRILFWTRWGGDSVQKILQGRAANISIWMTPYKTQHLVYEWVNFSKIFRNLGQNWPKFKKIWEESGDFAQNLVQNWADWYTNGSVFLEKLVFVWSTFKFRGGTSLPKPNWSTPLPGFMNSSMTVSWITGHTKSLITRATFSLIIFTYGA